MILSSYGPPRFWGCRQGDRICHFQRQNRNS